MTPVSAFFTRLLPSVLGCPEPLAQQCLVDSAIELCERGLVVQQDLDPINITAFTANYEFELPSQQELSQVVWAWADKTLLVPVPRAQSSGMDDTPGRPQYFTTRHVDEVLNLRLFPTPDNDVINGLRVTVALRPRRNATQVADLLFHEWAEVVVEGALARIHDIPGQIYTNEQKALVCRQKAMAAIGAARLEATRGRVMSSMSVRQRPFA